MSGFWDKFSKGTAIAGTVVGGTAVVAGVANKLINSNQKRKQQQLEMEIQKQDAALRQQQALLDQEIKLRELELKHRQLEVGANKDITITQINANRDMSMQNMKSQAAMQTTYMSSNADVQKAKVMYAENSALARNNGMFCDQSNGIAVDSRNVMNYNNNYGSMYPNNMGMMNVGMNPNYNNSSMNTNQLQQKLLDAKNLYDCGLIDEDEFEKLKNNILNSVN